MATVVGIHGIGQQLKGERVLRENWLPALRDGVGRTEPRIADDIDLAVAFYGDIFRPSGGKAAGDPPYEASDVGDGVEKDLLAEWWVEVARIEGVPGPDADTKVRTPSWVQRALNALSSSKYFAGMAERALVADLKQVRAFLTEPSIKARILERVASAVTADTKVLVGHSLGSVVAYEALCANPGWSVRALVTLGSPLGIPNVVFDRLTPRPVDGRGVWPGFMSTWTNIADGGDVVALRKQLAPQFGARVEDVLICNGATAHDIVPYLTAQEAGRAIAAGVR